MSGRWAHPSERAPKCPRELNFLRLLYQAVSWRWHATRGAQYAPGSRRYPVIPAGRGHNVVESKAVQQVPGGAEAAAAGAGRVVLN